MFGGKLSLFIDINNFMFDNFLQVLSHDICKMGSQLLILLRIYFSGSSFRTSNTIKMSFET